MSQEISDFDSLLNKLNGFGKYQKFNLFLMCTTAILTQISTFNFVFVAGIPDYRCRIPMCDNEIVTEYVPNWLDNAIPFENGYPKYCSRFALKNETVNTNFSNYCPAELFSKNDIDQCENDLVFPDRHITIVNDLKIFCEHNQWKLSMVGTFSSLGIILGGPISGFISDSYGRKKVLIITGALTAILGAVKSFATAIEVYIVLDVVETIVGYTLYSTAFIIGIELVGPSYRLLAATANNVCLSIGGIVLGAGAWYFSSWRILLRVLYLPGLVIISYWWLIPESIKWLICKNKYEEVYVILNRISKVNNRPLPDNYKSYLKSEENIDKNDISIKAVLRNRTLCLRFINCCITIMANDIIYTGLSLNSVTLSGHKYLNFIIVAIGEIPGCILCAVFLTRFSRRLTLGISYFMTGIFCILLYFITEGNNIRILIYAIGKLMSTIASSTMHIFITELFPTGVRNSIFNICYAFGGVGSMLAPQIPLLAFIWTPLPILTFGFFALLASVAAICFPETYNKELPDTIAESENITKITTTKL